MRTYTELCKLKTFDERFEYLKIGGKIGIETFGANRYLNQIFYRSKKWRSFRNQIGIRDDGNDMGLESCPIYGFIVVHHLNPVTEEQILRDDPILYDPENAICVSDPTHKAVHYGDSTLLARGIVERFPNDTCPWKV